MAEATGSDLETAVKVCIEKQSMSESAVRARAKTRGYRVYKSRQRSMHFNNLGKFMLVESFRGMVVLGDRFDASLERISEYLAELDQR
jgi:hypothetical protein